MVKVPVQIRLAAPSLAMFEVTTKTRSRLLRATRGGRKPNADKRISNVVKTLILEIGQDAYGRACKDFENTKYSGELQGQRLQHDRDVTKRRVQYYEENIRSLPDEFLNLVLEFEDGLVHEIAAQEAMERKLLGKEHEVLG